MITTTIMDEWDYEEHLLLCTFDRRCDNNNNNNNNSSSNNNSNNSNSNSSSYNNNNNNNNNCYRHRHHHHHHQQQQQQQQQQQRLNLNLNLTEMDTNQYRNNDNTIALVYSQQQQSQQQEQRQQQHQNYFDQTNYQHQHPFHHYEQSWNNKPVPAPSGERFHILNCDDPSFHVTNDDNAVAKLSESTIHEDVEPLTITIPETPMDKTSTICRSDKSDNHINGLVMGTRVSELIEQRARKRSNSSRAKTKSIETKVIEGAKSNLYRVENPSKYDILCGQSRICANHMGNQRFQAVLDDFAPRYDVATSKQDKMTMTKEIVATIHNLGGRFLKYKDEMWEEISTVAARDKVSHALRTKVASWKRQEQQRLQQAGSGNEASPSGSGRRGSRRNSKSKQCTTSRRRRSSASSASTGASDIIAGLSFDRIMGSSTPSESKINDMYRYQQDIFEAMTIPPRLNNSGSVDGIQSRNVHRSHSHLQHLQGRQSSPHSRRSSSMF